MGQDDEMDEVRPAAPGAPEPGPRRSTFTPAPEDAYRTVFGQAAGDGAFPRDAPPPNPSTAVVPPPGSVLPSPPQRKSLPDEDLIFTLGGDGRREVSALEAIEQLQQQLRIREQEAREFRNWERSMRAIGTPEALDAVEEVRTTFTEAIQVIPPFETVETATPGATPSAAGQAAAGAGEVVYDLVEPELSSRATGPTGIPPTFTDPPGPAPHDDVAETLLDEPTVQPADDEGIVIGQQAPAPTPPPTDAQAPPQRTFVPETAGPEPTATEHRTGRALRLFWLWFAANSSVLSLVLGAVLLGMGMSLRQAILATLAGIALSFLPIGLATLAAKWNGQPTIIVSRASFGRVGNIAPALISLLTRVLWGAALLWFLAIVGSELLIRSGVGGALSSTQLAILVAGAGFLLAVVIAFFGYRLIVWTQLVLSVASAGLIVAAIAVTWPLIDMTNALSIADGPWLLVMTGAILVFSYIGLAWATGAGDIARYQRQLGSGASSMLSASFGSSLPPFVLISYGAVLAASNPRLAAELLADPAGALASAVPGWFLLPLLAAVSVGLLSGAILSVYSGGFAAQALGLRMRRDVSVLLVGMVTGTVAIALTGAQAGLDLLFRDVATTLAVPTAAWLGIFAGEMMIRNRRFDTASLLGPGGVYPRARWVNLVMLFAATAVGYGLTTASVDWLSWQGYLVPLVGIPAGSGLAESDFGVLVAMALALLTPLLMGVRAIRRQESAQEAGEDSAAEVPGEAVTAHR